MDTYIMTVSYWIAFAKQYPEIDDELNTLIHFLNTNEKFKDYKVKVTDVTLSTCYVPTPWEMGPDILLTYLIKYEASQKINHLVGKFGTPTI